MKVRGVKKADFPTIKEIYQYYVENTVATFETNAPSSDELLNRWESHLEMPFIVALESNKVIGFSYVSPYHERNAYRFTVENSIYVAPNYVGKKVGRTLLEQLLNMCEQHGFKQVISRIAIWEGCAASIKLHEKFGFVSKGCLSSVGYKFDQYIDTILLQKSL